MPLPVVGYVPPRLGQTAAADQPPPEVRNVLLWQQARHNQATHDNQPGSHGEPTCRFCGTPWPCDPRINADEALAASYSHIHEHPSATEPIRQPAADQPPGSRPDPWPRRSPGSAPATGVARVHPAWLSPPPTGPH
jgi:hypothetical protein